MINDNMMRIIKPYISFQEVENDFKEIFDSGILTKGKYVQKFIEEIKIFTESKFCFLTTSATTALTTALKTVDVKLGDEVIISDFSFPATANVVEDLGQSQISQMLIRKPSTSKPEELDEKNYKQDESGHFRRCFRKPQWSIRY